MSDISLSERYKIEDNMDIEEAKILQAKKLLETEAIYDHEEAWKKLGV